MARRARSARRSPDKVPFAPPSPHIQRMLPHFDPLDSAGIERIEAQVDWMLENVGVPFVMIRRHCRSGATPVSRPVGRMET